MPAHQEIDWSQAPREADAWLYDEAGGFIWAKRILMADTWTVDGMPAFGLAVLAPAPSFGQPCRPWEITYRPPLDTQPTPA